MTGIAITLATREDGEAVGRIEKLIGHKIPRAGGEPAKEPEQAAKSAKPKSEPKAEARSKPHAEPKAERKPERKAEAKPQPKPERTPVVEDLKSDWNGPLPGFLSKSAG
jgi:superfamily II DNA/RNA helicase